MPASAAGLSVVVKSNPVNEWPGVIALDDATHSIAVPSLELLVPVSVLVHPVGLETALGDDGRKSPAGTQANQKVPMLVVPVSLRVMS